jgi:hypothetical protein
LIDAAEDAAGAVEAGRKDFRASLFFALSEPENAIAGMAVAFETDAGF